MFESASSFIALTLLSLNTLLLAAQTKNSLTPKEFEKQFNKKEAVLIDVRTPSDWRAGIITGAKLLNVLETDSFQRTISNWNRASTYLLYCNSGRKSQLALEQMHAAGFSSVYDLNGGYMAWGKYKPRKSRKIQPPAHRLVLQLSSNDSLVWKALMNNLKNLQEGWGFNAEVVVVTHGLGIDLLRVDKTTQQEKITYFTKLGIRFMACENTMRDRNVSKDQMVKEASFAKMGIGEVVRLQEAGWSYLKSGF